MHFYTRTVGTVFFESCSDGVVTAPIGPTTLPVRLAAQRVIVSVRYGA